MKILHIASYYHGSKVYQNLFSSLNLPYATFVAERNEINDKNDNVLTINCLNLLTKFFYSFKILTLIFYFYKPFMDLKKKGVNYIHSHTLYADGTLGFIFSLISDCKLIVTVRTTDIDFCFKFYFHYKWLAKMVLRRAQKIIFISPVHKTKFRSYFGNQFDCKLEVIPNGIDNFFIKEAKKTKPNYKGNITGLCIASFNKNKNLLNTIKAFEVAFPRDDYCKLNVVGGTYQDFIQVYGKLEPPILNKVSFLGRRNKKEILEEMNKSNFFIMVSHSETFGLVYLEAVSQCLPIIYSSGQGIDGYFEDGLLGFKADATSIGSISLAIRNTLDRYPTGLGPFSTNPACDFSWGSIAKIYKDRVYK